jgi:hypothetical protein
MLQELLFSVGAVVIAGALFIVFAMLKWRKRPRSGVILVRTGYGGILILRKNYEKCFCIPGIHKIREFKTHQQTVEYSLEDDEYGFTAEGLAVTAEIQTQLETLVDDASIARLMMEQAEPSRPKDELSGVMRVTIAQQIRNVILQHLFETIQDGIAIDAPDILAEIQTDVEKHGYRVISMNIMRVNLIRPNKQDEEFQHPQNITYIQQANTESEADNLAQQQAEHLEQQAEETESLRRQGEDEVNAANSQSDAKTELFKTTAQNVTDQITANTENRLSEIENANEAILQHAKGESTSERNNELENHRARNQAAAETNQQLKDKSQEFGLQKKETLLKSFQADATQQASEFYDITQTAKNKSKDELALKKAELDSIEQQESEAFENRLTEELAPWEKELASQKAKKEQAEQRIIELQQSEGDNTGPKDNNKPSV